MHYPAIINNVQVYPNMPSNCDAMDLDSAHNEDESGSSKASGLQY